MDLYIHLHLGRIGDFNDSLALADHSAFLNDGFAAKSVFIDRVDQQAILRSIEFGGCHLLVHFSKLRFAEPQFPFIDIALSIRLKDLAFTLLLNPFKLFIRLF